MADCEIRTMRADDVDAARELDAACFGHYFRMTGRGESIPPRSRENILACLALNPMGCLVAESKKVVGYIFSRHWGSVGWIGTFGVHNERHGECIGSRLLVAATDQLSMAATLLLGSAGGAERLYANIDRLQLKATLQG